MDLNLAGKVAVVTGASKGIGLAVTTALAAEGVLVVAGARNVDTLTGIAGVHPVSVNLTSADGPASLVRAAIDTFGGLDILVNNIGGVTPHLGGFVTVTDDDWLHALGTGGVAETFAAAAGIDPATVANSAVAGSAT